MGSGSGRPRPKTHKFAFTGLMRCSCDAMITAEEKYKRQKNGNLHHYFYYHCTRKINQNCTEKSVELKNLEKQIDTLLSDLSISDKFKEWAIKYLHEIRTEQAHSQEASFVTKQKRLETIIKQLDNLILLYTSPENADGQLLSADELKSTKSTLLKEKVMLEEELNNQGKQIEEWVELTEKTFNFTRYARTWFMHGDIDTKRAIFACLGSDLLLKDQKVALTLHKPFQIIFERKNSIEQELARLEPLKFCSMKQKSSVFAADFPLTSG